MTPCALSNEDRKHMQTLREMGYSIQAIADLFDMKRSSTHYYLSQHRVDQLTHRIPNTPIDKALEMLRAGMVPKVHKNASPKPYQSPGCDPETYAQTIMCGECKYWKAGCGELDALDVTKGSCARYGMDTSRLEACKGDKHCGYWYCKAASSELVKRGINPITMKPIQGDDEADDLKRRMDADEAPGDDAERRKRNNGALAYYYAHQDAILLKRKAERDMKNGK